MWALCYTVGIGGGCGATPPGAMSILCWNCRGLGNRQTVQELGDLIRAQDPTVVFLTETWLDDSRLAGLRDSLRFGHYHGVSRLTRGGGLVLFWKKNFDLQVMSSSKNHIDVLINRGMENVWRFTGFYGAPETQLRMESWDLLRDLNNRFSVPWICGGDFNELLKSHEKLGGRLRPYGQMQKFREALDECGLFDLGFVGNKFTWYKTHPGGGVVWERLDRAVSTNDWFNLFPATKVKTLVCASSDHSPILVLPEGIISKPQRPWRFEYMWLEKQGCHDTVQNAWNACSSNPPMTKVMLNVDTCKTQLQTWSKQSFCKVVSTLSEKKKILKEAEESATKGGCVDFFLQLKAEVAELLRVEEKMWQQRSHVHWMISGDKNSSYFHNRASQRFRRNNITEIKDSLGRKASGDKEVSVLFLDYYKNLFTTSNPHDIEEVVQHSKKVVSEEMNNGLIRNFSKDEVELALKQMAPLKAPGPDGMPPIFFQHYWESIGEDVVRAVVSCLNSNSIVPGLNHTFITLVPKVKSPEFVSEFRPIALCNILYKLVSKVLANRLKKILPHVISESQSAFQSDKAISDNILVAFETLHHMKRKRTGKMGQMALKLDMSKAYDRLEWVFLQRIMEQMGFHSKWIGWIMECVKSVSYSILVNGEPKGHIIPTRGIRQGDPLSPYLFLLCSEGLNGLIENAVDCNHIEGVSLCRKGPKISHLFFADDSLLFCRARVGDVEKIQECLGKYERASGQKINTDKTTLFFSKNTSLATKEELKILLGVPEIKEYERYLGLPTVVGRKKKASLNYIKDRVWGKLQGWKEKLLSQAGKEVLLKAVVQAIPTFAMSCFRLPIGLCQDIEMLIRKFWWGQRGDRRKIHWAKWEVLCQPKSEGGLGFKDLCKFNKAMLAKQVWRLVHNKESLFYRVFKAKYFPNCSIFEAKSSYGSFAWKSILWSREVIEKGAFWRIGNGKSVQIYKDSWLPSPDGRISSPVSHLTPESTVDSLINSTLGGWNTNLIDLCFYPPEAILIKSLPLCSTPQPDTLVWRPEKSGCYSVKSGYKLLCELLIPDTNSLQVPASSRGLWKCIWKLNVPGKVKHFLWRACSNSLPTKENLLKRKILQEAGCSRCFVVSESVVHALWSCDCIKVVWNSDFDWVDRSSTDSDSFSDVLQKIRAKPALLSLFATTAWSIWFQRNKTRLHDHPLPLHNIASFARNYLGEFKGCNSPHPHNRRTGLRRWVPPSAGLVKTNYDGAWFRESNKAGLGVVIRNSEGQVLAALSEQIEKPPSVEVLELLAARRAITFAAESGHSQVVCEGDSEFVVNALRRPGMENSLGGHIIQDIKFHSNSFMSISFVHVGRQGNAVAHAFAQRARQSFSSQIWLECVPTDVMSFVLDDFPSS